MAATLRRITRYVAPYWKSLVVVLILIVAHAWLDAEVPMLYRELVSKALPAQDVDAILTLSLQMISILGLSCLVAILQDYLSARVGEGVARTLRKDVLEHIHQLPVSFFTQTKTGELLSLLNNELSVAKDSLSSLLPETLFTLFTFFFTLYMMFGTSSELTFMALFLIPIFHLPTVWIGNKLKQQRADALSARASMNDTLAPSLDPEGVALLRTLGATTWAAERFTAASERLHGTELRRAVYQSGFSHLLLLAASAASAVIYMLGGLMLFTGSQGIDLGVLLSFSTYLGRLYAPMSDLSTVHLKFAQAMVAFERIGGYLDMPTESIQRVFAVAALPQPLSGTLTFEGVSYRYPDGQWALRDVSFAVPIGSTCVVQGPNGAGKSTLCQLMLRLRQPTQGRVTLAGIDIATVSSEQYSATVGYLSQHVYVLHDTLANNLRLARPSATEGDIAEASRQAGLDEVVRRLPHGYATAVGERGYHLSGGERQRLALARLLLQRPHVVILDEPTAHLDTDGEQRLYALLANWPSKRTMLVVSHKPLDVLAAAVRVDCVLRLDAGRVVEWLGHYPDK